MLKKYSWSTEHEEEASPLVFSLDSVDEVLINSRRILLIGEILDMSAAYITSLLQYFAQSQEEVYLYINSPGGDLFAGYSIVDQMMLSPFPITTIVRGNASSMAAIIAAHGTEGKRYITENSSMMLHSIQLTTNTDSINKHASMVDYYRDYYNEKVKELSQRTKATYDHLRQMMEQEYWLSPQKAIHIGLVDKIWTKTEESNIDRINDKDDQKA